MKRRFHVVDHRFHKAGMVVVDAKFVNDGGTVARDILRCVDVFAILPTTRVAAEGRRYERDGSFDAVLFHPPHGVIHHRMPIAIAEIHRQVDAVFREFILERRNQCPILSVDRTHAAVVFVVL